MKKPKYLYQANKDWPYHVSAGGVVVKREGKERLYSVLYMAKRWHDHETWHLPKGTIDHGETIEQAAEREVKEEAGLEGKIIGYLGTTNRIREPFYDKTTHYFLFDYVDGDGSTMDREHDRLEWYDVKTAQSKLSVYPKHEDEIIRRAELFIKKFLGV